MTPDLAVAVPIPVTLIGGYLGAGKTTLVNHLLRQREGRRIAVLVNDFGDLSIDADLIEAREGELLRLAGGCVCCSFGSDLVAALLQMRALRPAPDHILIARPSPARGCRSRRSATASRKISIGSQSLVVPRCGNSIWMPKPT